MENSKQIVQLPRLLRTPLKVNANAPRIMTPLPLTSRVHPRQLYWIPSPNLSLCGDRKRSLCAISSTHAASSPFTVWSTAPPSRHFLYTLSSTAPPCTRPPRGLPISVPVNVRYNSVYATIFKPARRAFHATTVRRRMHHFDTLKLVQRLKDEGLSEEQAVALMRVLNDVVEESIQDMTRTMVLKEGWLFFLVSFYVSPLHVLFWIGHGESPI